MQPLNVSGQLSEWVGEAEAPAATPDESPQHYRQRVGRCPDTMWWDGTKCVASNKIVKKQRRGPGQRAADADGDSKDAKTQADQQPQLKPDMSFKEFAAKRWNEAKKSLKDLPSALKKLPEKTSKWLKNTSEQTQAFFTDKPYRHAVTRSIGDTLLHLPKDAYEKVVKTGRHEVREFQHAGQALRKLATGKKTTEEDWDALVKVGRHMALTVAAAAATASGLGIVGATGKGLARGFGAKVVNHVAEQLHVGDELSHLAHFFQEGAREEDRQEDAAMEYVAQLIAKALADELNRGIPDDMLAQIANDAADADATSTTRQEQVESKRDPRQRRREQPDAYKKRVGRCPAGYVVDPETDSCQPADGAGAQKKAAAPKDADQQIRDLLKDKAAASQFKQFKSGGFYDQFRSQNPDYPVAKLPIGKILPDNLKGMTVGELAKAVADASKAKGKEGKAKTPAEPGSKPTDLKDPVSGKVVPPMTRAEAEQFSNDADASPTNLRSLVASSPIELGRAAAADPDIVDKVRDQIKFSAQWTKKPLSKREQSIISTLAKRHGFDADAVASEFANMDPKPVDDVTLGKLKNTDAGKATSAANAADRMKAKARAAAEKKALAQGASEEDGIEMVAAAVGKAASFFGEIISTFAAGALMAAPLILLLPSGPVLAGGGALMMVAHALGISPEARTVDLRGGRATRTKKRRRR